MQQTTNNQLCLGNRIHSSKNRLFDTKGVKRGGKYLIILSLLLLLTSTVLSACICRPYPIRDHYQASGLVFSGKVIAEETIYLNDLIQPAYSTFPEQIRQYTFEVQKVFKGRKISSQVYIYSGLGGGDCGFPFEIGQRYFVFAYQQSNWVRKGPTLPNHWYTDICSGTTSDWNAVAKMVLTHQF